MSAQAIANARPAMLINAVSLFRRMERKATRMIIPYHK